MRELGSARDVGGPPSVRLPTVAGTVAAETELLESDLRASFPRFTVEARRRNWAVIELLRQVGLPKGKTPAQVAPA